MCAVHVDQWGRPGVWKYELVYTVTGCCTVIRLTVKIAGDEVSQLSGNSVKEREGKRNTRKGKRSIEDKGRKKMGKWKG